MIVIVRMWTQPTRVPHMYFLETVKPQLISIDEACTMLRLSRTTIYQLARSGQVEIKKLGPKTARVVVASLERYIESLPGVVPGSPVKLSSETQSRRQEERERRRAEAEEGLKELGL